MIRLKQTFSNSIYLEFMRIEGNSGAVVISEAIILEIIMLGYSSLFWKCSKLHAHFRNAIKNREKVFCFWDNGVWNCCCKCSILLREYLSSAVNVLTNSFKISDPPKADFFQLNLPRVNEKRGKWWCRADFSSLWNPLTRSLPNGVLKQDLLHV